MLQPAVVNTIWIYQIPNWILCAIVVSIFTVSSLLLLYVTRPIVKSFPVHHNDIVASFAASAGVLYAVLLAMIAVASWTNYTTVDSLVAQEADLVYSLFRDLEAYPEPERSQLRELLRNYVDTTIKIEWPAIQRGVTDKRAAMTVDAVFSGWMKFEPTTEAQKLVVAETLGRLNSFQSVRRNRITTGISGLEPVLWIVVIVGGIVNTAICCLFWLENKRLHYLMMGVLGMMIGVVVFLILALDHPLWGELSIQPTAFQDVADSMDRVLHPLTPGERRISQP